MANRFLSSTEIARRFLEVVEEISKGDVRIKREILYDWQTSMGGFPYNEEERRRYIETGSTKTKPTE